MSHPQRFARLQRYIRRWIKLVPRSEPLVSSGEIDGLFKVARSAFLGRRKQLHNSLANGLGMTTDEVKEMTTAVGIDSERRPATLSIDEWIALAHHWRNAYRSDKTEIVAG